MVSTAGSIRALAGWAAFGVLMAAAAGCSLISLKSPEKPLSARDLEARILTREYSARFIGAVEQAADQIATDTQDPEIRLNALRWKIAAAGKSQRAAGQMVPMMGLLDTWALSVQMSEFLAGEAGLRLFGPQRKIAVTVAAELTGEAEDLARRLTMPEEFAKDQRFVDDYARAHPIEDLHFTRASVVGLWARDAVPTSKLVDSFGTVPEALADAGDLLRMYGDTGPEQVLWQAELAAEETGISAKDVRAAIQRLDERIARLYALADATPKLVGGAVRGAVRDAGTRFDSSWAEMMRDVRDEGATLSGSLSTEREAAVNALDVERAAVAANAAQIAAQVVRDTGEQVRRLVREALLLVIVLTLVMLGVPFAAGYFLGRARRRPAAPDT